MTDSPSTRQGPLEHAILQLVPVGHENRIGALEVWKRAGVWAKTTIRHKLEEAAKAGQIIRTVEPPHTCGTIHLYHREP